MKLKFLFLGMFAAAAMISCNNEGIDNGPVIENGVTLSKGIPTYVALDLPKQANTRAGVSSLIGHPDEKNIGNVAVFVYKMDAAKNIFPENYAYVGANTPPVILKTTDGTKKVFLALNVGSGTAAANNFFNLDLGPANVLGEGASGFTTTFQNLNNTLWSNGTSGYNFAKQTTPTTVEGSSNGLIKTLAGGTASFTQGLLIAPTGTPNAGRYYLMSNWDNDIDDINGVNDYKSTCVFTFSEDIPKSNHDGTGSTTSVADGTAVKDKNHVKITVQRAVAKATMKFSSTISLHTDGFSYLTDGNDTDKGYFTPWGRTVATEPGIFAAGNINKEASIFQKFDNSSVADDNYGFITCDPIAIGGNDEWYANFDNIRVFGTGKSYRNNNYVSTVRTTMMNSTQGGDPNSYKLGTDTIYLTENAQSWAYGKQDNSTYLVVGGKYSPRHFISLIKQANVVTNAPILFYNNVTPTGTELPGDIIYGSDYAAVNYNTTPASNDTLYYHIGMKLFIHGKANLANYYAWILKQDTSGVGSSIDPITSLQINPVNDTKVTRAINADFSAGTLMSYYQGNCFYRIFIKDDKATLDNEKVLVRRNHVYDVTIAKILGPGIADPDKIIIPGENVLPVDTYIAITIEIQDWHKVNQSEDVDNK